MVQAGQVHAQDKIGNGMADSCANRGTRSSASSAAPVAEHNGKREKQYIELAQQICTTIVTVMRAVAAKLNDQADQTKLQHSLGLTANELYPLSLDSPSDETCNHYPWQALQKYPRDTADEHRAKEKICRVLAQQRRTVFPDTGQIEHQVHEKSGCTWLELFIFDDMHGINVDDDVANEGQVTLAKRIATFKRRVRDVAERTLGARHAQGFHPSRAKANRLLLAGIANEQAGIRIRPQHIHSTANAIFAAVLQQAGRIDGTNYAKWANQHL